MADLHAALERIRAQGPLTPSAVLEDARPPDSELHHRFEWDDAHAAELHRLATAAQLIRSVRVTEKAADGETRHHRVYWTRRDEDRPSSVYEPVTEIAADPVAARLLLASLEREWKMFRRRWSHLSEFVAIIQRDLGGEDAA